MDALRIGLWSWQGAPHLIRYSPVTANLFGVPTASCRSGLPLARFIAAVHPEDRERFTEAMDQTLGTGGPFVAEYRTIPALGTERWLLDRGEFELGHDGRAVAGRGMVIDLTERVGEERIKGTAFFSPGFQNLPPMERAVEHVLAISELLDEGVIPGNRGELLRVMMDEVLKIVGQEVSAQLERDEYDDGARNSGKSLH